MTRTMKNSVTYDANPEGVNQYTGGGSNGKVSSKNATRIAVKMSNKATEKVGSSPLKLGTAHSQAEHAHKMAAKINRAAGNTEMAEKHEAQAKMHGREANLNLSDPFNTGRK